MRAVAQDPQLREHERAAARRRHELPGQIELELAHDRLVGDGLRLRRPAMVGAARSSYCEARSGLCWICSRRHDGAPDFAGLEPARRLQSNRAGRTAMLQITALFTTLALGATASIAMASPIRTYDRRSGVEYARGGAEYARSDAEHSRLAGSRFRGAPPPGNGVERVRIAHTPDRFARLDGVYRRYGGRGVDDFGPRRYRPTWVALGAPHRLGGSECIEVRDPGTFTQLRLQSDSGFADVDRVIVEFADGTDQVAELDRALDRRGEFVELPLDGNNRRIEKILVTGALGDLQVFAI
jgi:hypothetical protein